MPGPRRPSSAPRRAQTLTCERTLEVHRIWKWYWPWQIPFRPHWTKGNSTARASRADDRAIQSEVRRSDPTGQLACVAVIWGSGLRRRPRTHVRRGSCWTRLAIFTCMRMCLTCVPGCASHYTHLLPQGKYQSTTLRRSASILRSSAFFALSSLARPARQGLYIQRIKFYIFRFHSCRFMSGPTSCRQP